MRGGIFCWWRHRFSRVADSPIWLAHLLHSDGLSILKWFHTSSHLFTKSSQLLENQVGVPKNRMHDPFVGFMIERANWLWKDSTPLNICSVMEIIKWMLWHWKQCHWCKKTLRLQVAMTKEVMMIQKSFQMGIMQRTCLACENFPNMFISMWNHSSVCQKSMTVKFSNASSSLP